MNAYRYAVDIPPHSADATLTRGRVYCLRDTGCDTSDDWRWYWEDSSMVAFYENFGVRHEFASATDNVDTERVLQAVQMHRGHGDDEHFIDMLNRPGGLAFRLTGQWEAKFIKVDLDRSTDFYALSWDGDPDHGWRDEIENVYHGEIYRMEVQRYDADAPSPGWYDEDDYCDQWYGEAKADEALAEKFPLEEFPAELLIEDRAS